MKSEVIIKNWLMAWLRPKYVTEYNTQGKADGREDLTEYNFDAFMNQFIDNKKEPIFDAKEIASLKPLVTAPLQFSSGYPINAAEPEKVGTIYIIESGWQQKTGWIGSSRLEGQSQTDITIVGGTAGGNINMAEPSLISKLVTSILIAGRNYFTAFHLEEPVISERNYSDDEQRSFMFEAAMRTVTMSYTSDRFQPITKYKVSEDG